jgi:hypothetical protein
MKVKSFGCSFIFGNELQDDSRDLTLATPSQLTWPALVAQELGAEYQCFARPESGNFRILEQIMHQMGLNDPDVFVIVGWSWIERFDYIVDGNATSPWREHWETITPTTASDQADFYYRHFHSELRDKLQSLVYIRTAVDLLHFRQIPFIMTCIDDLLLDRHWHIPVSVTDTQDYIRPYISDFQGQNFLDWSRRRGFPIGKWLHPLEEAHAAAADLMLPLVQAQINI